MALKRSEGSRYLVVVGHTSQIVEGNPLSDPYVCSLPFLWRALMR